MIAAKLAQLAMLTAEHCRKIFVGWFRIGVGTEQQGLKGTRSSPSKE